MANKLYSEEALKILTGELPMPVFWTHDLGCGLRIQTRQHHNNKCDWAVKDCCAYRVDCSGPADTPEEAKRLAIAKARELLASSLVELEGL